MARDSPIGVADFLHLISPDGRAQIAEFIDQAKQQRGARWLEEIKADYPTFCFVIDLIANRTADEAFEELKRSYPMYPLGTFKTQLMELHGFLRAEIDKPR